MVVIIIGVAVVLPVIVNVTDSAGLTGIAGTIVSYLSTFVAIALLLDLLWPLKEFQEEVS